MCLASVIGTPAAVSLFGSYEEIKAADFRPQPEIKEVRKATEQASILLLPDLYTDFPD